MFISPRHDFKVDETSGRCINGYSNSAEPSSSSNPKSDGQMTPL